MPLAYSYIRFSTPEQQKGDSLRRQTEKSSEYAAKHGLTLDTSFDFHDLGLSAYDKSNVERGALGGFLKAVEEGKIATGSYLLVESLDRLSRLEVSEALELFLSIIRRGITIVTFGDNKVYNKESINNNFTDIIVSITIMARAHEESLTKSQRIKAAWSNKRANLSDRKLTAQCPRWMKLNDSRTNFELIPERVEVVKEVLELAKYGMGQAQIAKRLNERFVSPFSNKGKGWHSSYIQKILTSTALYGEFQPGIFENGKVVPHGDPVPAYYPALITKEEFFLLQSQRSERAFGGAKAKKGDTVPNLLSGVAKCGYCGSPMIMVGATAKRTRTADGAEMKRPAAKVLVCDGARRGLGCFAVQWNYKDFETSFLTFCRGLELDRLLTIVNADTGTNFAKNSIGDHLQAANAEIDKKERLVEKLVDAIGNGANAPASIVERIRSYEQDLDRLKDLKKRLQIELHTAESVKRQLGLAAESMRGLIVQMGSLEKDALFKVRVALADHIRRHIKVVRVFPAGRLHSAAEIQQIRDGLVKAGYTADQINEHIHERYRTEPLRQGRGIRGRYASRKDIARLFQIQAKNGSYVTVYPNFDDPSKLVFGTEIQREGNSYRMINLEFDDPLKTISDPEVTTT